MNYEKGLYYVYASKYEHCQYFCCNYNEDSNAKFPMLLGRLVSLFSLIYLYCMQLFFIENKRSSHDYNYKVFSDLRPPILSGRLDKELPLRLLLCYKVSINISIIIESDVLNAFLCYNFASQSVL